MEIEALPLDELPDGTMRLIPGNGATLGLYRCGGVLYAIEDRWIPLTPVRLKCALLGLGVLKVALHRAKGTALPDEWGTSSGEISLT